MSNGQARFLLFLCVAICLAQLVEIVAFLDLATSFPVERLGSDSADWSETVSSGFWIFATSAGPFFGFALAGLLFQHSNWGMTCWMLCATAYAVMIILGLLCEYGMAHQAAEAAARGSRYMNCGGHPRLFMMLFGIPFMAASFCLSIGALFIESVFRVLSASPTQRETMPNG